MADLENFGALREENKRRLEELAHAHERADDPLAEAMRTPVEDRVAKWKREADEQEARFAKERRRRERRAEPAPINWDLRISEAIVDERRFMIEVIAETIVEQNERQREAIDAALQPLRFELAELKVSAAELKVANAELRIANASLREQSTGGRDTTIDLPALPLRSGRVN